MAKKEKPEIDEEFNFKPVRNQIRLLPKEYEVGHHNGQVRVGQLVAVAFPDTHEPAGQGDFRRVVGLFYVESKAREFGSQSRNIWYLRPVRKNLTLGETVQCIGADLFKYKGHITTQHAVVINAGFDGMRTTRIEVDAEIQPVGTYYA